VATMAVIIAKKVAFDLSKAFKMLVTSDNSYLCIYFPFSDEEACCWEERLSLKEDTDGEALLSYLVQAKESDVILVWEDLLKNFRKKPEKQEEEKGEVQRLKEEVEGLRRDFERLQNECKLLMYNFDALRRRLGDEDDE